ncbi:uncharacterized protein LOC135847793 [Planococcus citri]|uniref:uncharacterized protein LOC135847793 n=1 Tax=Planococcus citri TaxID=170843 RepID=UPI0031F8F89F
MTFDIRCNCYQNMPIIWIAITLAYLELAKSKAMSWNNIGLSSQISQITSQPLKFKQKEITKNINFSERIEFDSHEFDNFTRNSTEIEAIQDSTPKGNFSKENSTIGKIYSGNGLKMNSNFLHKKTVHLETSPEFASNEKTSVPSQGRSLPSENDTISDILIFTILSIFILTLIAVTGFTFYNKHSQASMQINEDISKDEKKLRYREVATEEPPNNDDEEATRGSWRKTLISKISLPSTCKLKSANNSTTSENENEIEIQPPPPDTPSTRTLSTGSNTSTRAGSCIEPSNEAGENKDAGQETSRKSTLSRTFSFLERVRASLSSKKDHEDNLDVSKKICTKCNHYRDPQMIIKRIEEVERRGGRILIPIQLPVTLGSGRIKTLGFPKLSRGQSTPGSGYHKCHRGSCCIANQSNFTPSTSGYSQKSQNRKCHQTSESSIEKSKTTDRQSSPTPGCSQQQTDEQYFVESDSLEKSKINEDNLSSKSLNLDKEICGESQKSCKSAKPSATSTCTKSKSEALFSSTRRSSSCDTENVSNSPTTRSITRRSSIYGSNSRTARIESQNGDHYGSSNQCTSKIENSSDDSSETASKASSSYYNVPKLEIEEHYSDEEQCQDAPSERENTNSSAACSIKSIPSNLSTTAKCISGSNQSIANRPSRSNSIVTSRQSCCDLSSQNGDSFVKKSKTKSTDDLTSSQTSCKRLNQCNLKCTSTTQSNKEPVCAKTPLKAPVKFKVLSTDPDYDPSTLQVKQQLKMLLQDNPTSSQSATQSKKNRIRPGQVIYADLCFVQQQPAVKCKDNSCRKSSSFCESTTKEGIIIGTQSSGCSVLQKNGNVTSESESDAGYGPSHSDSNGNEDLYKNVDCSTEDNLSHEAENCYRKCVSTICCDDYPRASSTRRLDSGLGRRDSDLTLNSCMSADSRGHFIQSLNQRLKGNYLQQSKGSSHRSRLSSSSRYAPVFEYAEDTDDCDVYEPIDEHLETGARSSMRSSMNKLLPRIRSYMARRKKSSICGSELYSEPSIEEGSTELCENCMKCIPRDISKTIRSRQSLYTDVEKFKHGGTIHLNDLIAVYPNLYPKLPIPVREALSKGFDDYSVSPYGNLCENNQLVQETKWSDLSSSFENINCTH